MKKKTTFYIEEETDKQLTYWLYKYFELTGKKMTKTAVIHMLLNALFDTDNVEADIREIQ